MKTLLTLLPIVAGICLLPAPGSGQTRAPGRSVRSSSASQSLASLKGTYTRIKKTRDENQSATLDVVPLGGDRIKIHLTALFWSVGKADSPHNGEIEATVTVRKQVAVYKSADYRLTLRFRGRDVVLTESGSNEEFGAFVRAAGTYRRTSGRRARDHR